MPNIKMINGVYSDDTAIHDVVNYCFDHNLVEYYSTYLPMPGYLNEIPAINRKQELESVMCFWNNILDQNMKNYGKRLLHFSIGFSYIDNKWFYNKYKVQDTFACLYDYALQRGFPSVAVEHITEEGYCHIHYVIGTVNIYGERYDKYGITAKNIAQCIGNKIGEFVVEKYDD